MLWLSGCGHPALQLEGDPVAGQQTYDADCTLCHSPDGSGSSRGPDLRDLEARQAPSLTLQVIEEGDGEMPAYAYSDPVLADLLAYLHTL